MKVFRKIQGAGAVSLGILGSRIIGFVRESLFAHYFGNSLVADAFRASLRIPNLLQNLFGEGVLSASFIPVYARLNSQGKEEVAKELSSIVFGILALITSLITLLGLIFTPALIDLITPGFEGEVRELSIHLVRILFPGTALLVLSAWCLGVQNSHRKFLLSYSAPIIWNLAIIVAIFLYGNEPAGIINVTWGVTIGCALQLLVQLPSALRLNRGLKFSSENSRADLKTVFSNFVPVVISRGVVQISAFFDSIIASLLPLGSLSSLSYAQTLYLLPVSLFGMSVSAAELPELSSINNDERSNYLSRLERAIHKVLFFVIPTAVAFLFIGDALISIVFESGKFNRGDTFKVWAALSILALGLPLSTVSRLFSSFFYSRNEAKKLLWVSLIRVTFSAGIGALLSVYLGYGLKGLCAGTTLGAVLEFLLLSNLLKNSLGVLPKVSNKVRQIILICLIAGFISRMAADNFYFEVANVFISKLVNGLTPVVVFGSIFVIGVGGIGFRMNFNKFFDY